MLSSNESREAGPIGTMPAQVPSAIDQPGRRYTTVQLRRDQTSIEDAGSMPQSTYKSWQTRTFS